MAVLPGMDDDAVRARVREYMAVGAAAKLDDADVDIDRDNDGRHRRRRYRLGVAGHRQLPVQFIVLQPVASWSSADQGRPLTMMARRPPCVTKALGSSAIWLACASSSFWRWRSPPVAPSRSAPIATCRTCPTREVDRHQAGRRRRGRPADRRRAAPEDLRVIQWPANTVPRLVRQARRGGRPRPDPAGGAERAVPAGKLASKEAGAGLPPVIPEGFAPCRCASTTSSASPDTCCPAPASTSSRP